VSDDLAVFENRDDAVIWLARKGGPRAKG
jgi:hypothetical protein